MRAALALASSVFLFSIGLVTAGSIQFCGFDWTVRSGRGGPGPNLWDTNNVWLDASGALHLKISRHQGQWSCAEITLPKRLGFGRYDFQIKGAIDQLDDNVVLGLFNYPTREVGPDATHEIDVEFARWGDPKNPMGNYTVWPVDKALKQQSHSFPFSVEGGESTHRFTWNRSQIEFKSWRGFRSDGDALFGDWTFRPEDAARRISQQPMPVHLNLWLFRGVPPKNGQELEIVVQRFTFTPE
jgi:hypothetical protein